MVAKNRGDLAQVTDISEEAARLIEGTVVRVFNQTRTAHVRLDGSSQFTTVNLGIIDPSLVGVDGSRILLYKLGTTYYAVAVIPGAPGSSPGITLGDRQGGTKLSVYNSLDEEVLYIDSLGNISGGVVETDHGTLDGLADDDHPQYAAIAQTEAISGAWTFNTNVGAGVGITFDGVDISDHDARHERAGADEIDGDHLDIDFTPSNYTPATTPAEAADVDDLAAHLYGIDQELSGGVDDKRLKVSTDDTTPGFLEEKLVVSHGTNAANPLELSTLSGGGDEDRQVQFDEAKVDHDALLNFVGDEHIAHSGVTLTAGAGLTGGGTIAASRTFAVGAGDGIDVAADSIAVDVTDIIDTSYGLTEDTNNIRINLAAISGLNFSTGALLVGAGDGIDVLTNTIAVDVTDILGNGLGETSNNIYVYALRQSDDGAAALSADADGDMTAYGGITFDVAESIATSAGNLTLAPAGDITIDPVGNDMSPFTNYDINLGSLSKKYLTLHAAELWVETLVAQDTIATIGGRVLVGPTTQYAADLASGSVNSVEKISNPGFETAGAGDPDFFANWTETASDGAIAQDGVVYQEGLYSCKLTAGASIDTLVYQDIAVTAGTRIILQFWTRGDGTYAGRYRIYDVSNTADIIALVTTGVTAATWTKMWLDFEVPVGCSSIRVYFYCPGTDTGVANFDNTTAMTGVQITVKHNEMAEADIAYSESDGKIEFYEIASAAVVSGDYYTYWVRRDRDGTGANDWYAGDALFNTGVTGEGFIDLYSVHGIKAGTEYGPTIVGNVRNSATFNDWTPHWAIGNLNGIYGYGVDTYGVGLGEYSGSDYLTIDSTNGIRFLDSDDTVQASLAAGVWVLGEVDTNLSNIQITSGAIKLRTNTTDHIELTTAGTFWAGDTANTERVQWDLTNGLRIYDKDNAAVMQVDPTDAIFKFGADITAAGTTAIIIIGEDATTYNSESLDDGDLLIGDNTASKANIFWDKSEGRLNFRGGTTTEAYVDTDGSIVAGGGALSIAGGGISIGITDSYSAERTYSFNYEGTQMSGLRAQRIVGTANVLNLTCFSQAGLYSSSGISSLAPTTYPSYITLRAESGSDITELKISNQDDDDSECYMALTMDNATSFFINDNANTEMAIGLTINQGTYDDEIISLKSSDIDHGVSNFTETDTYGVFHKQSGTDGALRIDGYCDAGAMGLVLTGLGVTDNTTKGTSGLGTITMGSYKKSGAGVTNVGTNGNLVVMRNNATTRFIFDAEGEMHSDAIIGVGNDWDDWDDLALASDLSRLPKAKWDEMMRYGAEDFERAGLLTLSIDEDGTRHAFMKTKAMLQFSMCCFREVYDRMRRYEQALVELGMEL